MKKKLIIIEGFDRVGKDTFADRIMELSRNNSSYIFLNDRRNYLKGITIPDYNDKEAFGKFLDKGFKTLTEDLMNQQVDSLLVRWISTEKVYSSILERKDRSDLLKYEEIDSKYDIFIILLLFRNYEEYLIRCSILNCEIEYDEEQFNFIQHTLIEESEKVGVVDINYFPGDFESASEFAEPIFKNLSDTILNLRESLAGVQHDIWSSWMQYMFSQCSRKSDGTIVIPKNKVERWTRQMITNYNDLSESEKDSDRHQADKFIHLIKNSNQ